MEVKEQYDVKISNRSADLENLDDNVVVKIVLGKVLERI